MQPWVLDLNDTRLSMTDGEHVLATSPGYAIARANDLLIGAAAFDQARAHPRQLIDSFWARLDSQAMPVPGAPLRTAAEYVHAHLSEIAGAAGAAANQSVILATPGHLSREQLALLLGIAAQSPLRAVGLIDAPLATAIALGMREACLHIDINMHTTTLSQLVPNDGIMARGDVTTDAALGWVKAQDTWLRVISERFVTQCRFDPRRHAASEQLLYANLATTLADLRANAEVTLNCAHRTGHFQVRIPTSVFANALREPQLAVLACARRSVPRGTPIIVSHVAAQVPGLAELLSLWGPVQCAPALASATGALAHHRPDEHGAIGGAAALPFVRALPIGAPLLRPTARLAMPARALNQAPPTLLLLEHRLHAARSPLTLMIDMHGNLLARDIHALAEGQLPVATLLRSGDDLLLMPTGNAAVALNGEAITATQLLATGDTFTVTGASDVLKVVEMEVEMDGEIDVEMGARMIADAP